MAVREGVHGRMPHPAAGAVVMRTDQRPCLRCGVPVWWSRTASVSGICRDCRQVDPEFVQAMITGQPIITAGVA